MEPTASIVIPTRARLRYLEVALASVLPQALAAGAEVLVVDDEAPSLGARELTERLGAHYESHGHQRGLNAARNTGVELARAELLLFLDDDVRVCAGWLEAMLVAVAEQPLDDVFAGRILASLEGPAPRSCKREPSPITTLDIGDSDRRTPFAWGSNMGLRREALERLGPFDESLHDGGDEQEWQERPRGAGRRDGAFYVAGATVEHRRVGSDAGLRSLCRAAYVRGAAARRFDARRGVEPSLSAELGTLAGCAAHVALRRCPAGLTMVSHSAGRTLAALRERRSPAPAPRTEDFLSGRSGTVGGLDGLRRLLTDELAGAAEVLTGRRLRLGLAARHEPPLQRVLVLGVERAELRAQAAAIRSELLSSRHDVEVFTMPAGGAGKFENLNALLELHPAKGNDWLLLVDDDIELPRNFLDRFLFLCERFGLTLAQPAHALHSHAAWAVTRRRARSVVRETSFVEIGPVTAFRKEAFELLLPFPGLRMGWGLDMHWGALAARQAWRCGVVDAVAIHHRQAPAGAGYGREQAIAEARSFLAERPHLSATDAERTLVTHTSW